MGISKQIVVSSFVAATLVGCGSSQLPLMGPGAMPRSAAGGTYQVLHRFSGGSDGSVPDAGLIRANGTFYGTTGRGGVLNCPGGCGAVYSISTTGVEKPLYDFKGGSDGANPASVLINLNGKLFGSTVAGGGSPCALGGCGTIYSISAKGNERVLYRFGGDSDGAYPAAALIEVNGTLYGTTSSGGSSGFGTVFSISTSGSEKTLYSFAGGSDGAAPRAALVDVNGTLYGTTVNGGGSSCSGGCGTVFKMSTNGNERVLYRFTGGSDGAYPEAGLIEVSGRLYGTTSSGGGSGCYGYGCGTAYSVTSVGTEKVLYRFKRGAGGSQPAADLINVNGTLYGTTVYGGDSGCSGGCGTVYSLSSTGVERVLHRFNGRSGGAAPQAAMTSLKGALYGTTSAGGSKCYGKFSCGIVFSLANPLSP